MTFPTIHPAILPELNLSDPVAKANILLNAFRVAINGGLSVFNMVDGVIDGFEDETGVTTKTGATYDANGDYYHNPGGEKMISAATGTIEDSGSTPFGYAGRVAANAFDGVLYAASEEDEAQTNNTSSNAALGKNWGAATLVTKAIAYNGPACYTFINTSHDYTLQGWNGSAWVDLDGGTISSPTRTSGSRTMTYTGEVSYTKHRVLIDNLGGTNQITFGEIEFYTIVDPADMTLISDPYTAEAEPDEAFIVIWEEDVDTLTLNTDLKAWASCVGSTFAQATLTEVATIGSGRILTGTADVSGQTGTTMHWKITTHNNKELKVHAVGLEWS
jgi:hypothetical protein